MAGIHFSSLAKIAGLIALAVLVTARRLVTDYHHNLQQAYALVNSGAYNESIPFLLRAVEANAADVDASQLLGSIYVKAENYRLGIEYLAQALNRNEWRDVNILANYVEALRMSGNLKEAQGIAAKYHSTFPSSSLFLYNFAVVEEHLENYPHSLELYGQVLDLDPYYHAAWKNAAEILLLTKQFETAERVIRTAMNYFPRDYFLLYLLGSSFQLRSQLEEAVYYYHECLQVNPDYYLGKSNLGAAYQTLGKADLALQVYESAMPFRENDSGIRNNYGALLGTMNRKEEEIYWLKEALIIDPTMTHALINLAGYYQDEGLLDEAFEYLLRAREYDDKKTLLSLRIALMVYPVCTSWKQMVRQRNDVEARVRKFLEESRTQPRTRDDLDATMDRIHFYIQYHGLNDRYLQELIVSGYHAAIKDLEYFSPTVTSSIEIFQHQIFPDSMWRELKSKEQREGIVSANRKVRIGFISKFFGIFEPHGLLLDGVMKYLPRNQYEVFALPVARTDGKPLSPSISEAVDHVVDVSLTHTHGREMISALRLDILLFADTMSEPMAHFLAHSRMATIQVAFWGNPITSGSYQLDYFVSADFMEHPFRTRMPLSDEPYSEQVVLIDGQGIWYERPEHPSVTVKRANFTAKLEPDRVYERNDFNFSKEWFIFFCPQSVFKMHPLFDHIFAAILRNTKENVHLVITGGRRPRWTDIYTERLSAALDYNRSLCDRLHVIQRVSSEKFLALLEIADVILHPFPFDGSRTSADALIAGVPLLTMPTEYLRGRMGASFLRTMNIPELVARNLSEYISIAIRLSEDVEFYADMVMKIEDRIDLIWEDLDTIFSWIEFFSTASGLPRPSWDTFIQSTGRDVAVENNRRDKRRQNQWEFDRLWGPETWLLENGVARLENRLTESEVPKIFNNWKKGGVPPSENAQSHAKSHSNAHVLIHEVLEPKLSRQEVQLNESHVISSNVGSGTVGISDSLLSNLRRMIINGEFGQAHSEAIGLLNQHPALANDAQFLLEYGALQYYRSDYAGAFKSCQHVVQKIPSSMTAHSCVGVSGMYLNRENETLEAFIAAWNLAEQKVPNPLESSSFGMNKEMLEFNLFSALNNFRRYQDCVEVASTIMRLPLMERGGAYPFMFSLVKWSPLNFQKLNQLGEYLKEQGLQLSLSPTVSFLDEILRIQRNFEKSTTPIVECIMEYLPPSTRSSLISHLFDMVSIPNTDLIETEKSRLDKLLSKTVVNAAGVFDRDLVAEIASKGVTLLTQHFNPSNPALRQDLSDALHMNLKNPGILSVHLLNEELMDYSQFPNNQKITQHVLGKRLTFQDAFLYANKYLINRTVVLANADIYFDDSLLTLGDVEKLDLNKKVIALLKWTTEVADTHNLRLQLRTDSQDAWIFQTPAQFGLVLDSSFPMGVARCDNRLAKVLELNGYEVLNPAFQIRAIELHRVSREGHLYHTKDAVVGEGSHVLISDQYWR